VIIFTEVFGYLPAKDTLTCSLVCKEWLPISRCDKIWEGHYKRDLLSRNKPKKLIKKTGFLDFDEFDYSHEKDEVPPLSGKHPAFLEYFQHLDGILDFGSFKHDRKNRMKRCGIGAIPRNDNVREEQNVIDSQQNTVIDSQINKIIEPQQNKEIEIEVEGEEMVGCCHDSVNQISQSLFSKKSFVSLCEGIFLDEKQLNQWKKSLTQKVSLECMENEMEENQIKERISNLIESKLFTFY